MSSVQRPSAVLRWASWLGDWEREGGLGSKGAPMATQNRFDKKLCVNGEGKKIKKLNKRGGTTGVHY